MLETHLDPRQSFLSKICLDNSRVEFNQAHIVLLCGGRVLYKERNSDPDPPIASLRHAITHSNPVYETYRPEDITDWQSDGVFNNLMSFEEDLAAICTLVVIVLETPGAIAELGAFSQLPELSEKIIVIQSLEFEKKNSFINLGILRFIKDVCDSRVKSYPWDISSPNTISPEIVTDVVGDIEEELKNLPQSLVFKNSLNSHIVVLVYELIDHFCALKETELLNYLVDLKIKIHKEQLKRKLFLLEKFQIIKRETYSDSVFYVVGKYKYHKLRIALKDNTKHDAIRFQMECLAYYKGAHKERNRFRVIQKTQAELIL